MLEEKGGIYEIDAVLPGRVRTTLALNSDTIDASIRVRLAISGREKRI